VVVANGDDIVQGLCSPGLSLGGRGLSPLGVQRNIARFPFPVVVLARVGGQCRSVQATSIARRTARRFAFEAGAAGQAHRSACARHRGSLRRSTEARSFYLHMGLIPFTIDPDTLLIRLLDVGGPTLPFLI